ncbi:MULTISPECIES: ABC transporter ATP-binding protein [Lactiplantibacillus]|uniref:ABC transporter ATP-binding protein n=1 Tax=Lactiplantibacillus pentosus TaxID=1589 RepID=A0A3M6LG23_LACPE|nr:MULTISPECIES: ABC transporter ATP-binding protein [Lactiplantibacillus]AYG38913.1 ABC transporter ATP-binding protein [Lactiplantibacillus pentosus]AYG41573.1 ABC transporter ATP-binding protein [Lactiplantibacillus pentosus]MBU7472638.1 ABC transporter ATP-binding protein [Lactiplantibacillus pentosus]MBU7527896.1 ABC transporter ATP-binding protein [Lactiplantibacillus pentosus]MCC3163529.1 ABC transporter ATP-binding protein/permease [Lactiplantibacillus pentosus]
MKKLLGRLNKKEWGLIGLSALLIIIQVGLELQIPSYMTQITTALEMKGTSTSDVLKPGGLMLMLSILSMLTSIAVGFIAAKVAAGFAARLRASVFGQVMDYSNADIKQFSVPSLLTRSTNDITQIQQFVAMGMQVIIKAPITAIWAISKIANKGWQWTTATGVAVLVLVAMLTVILTLVQPRFKIVQGLTDRLNAVIRENLNGIRVVHAYNAEDYQNNKFQTANDNLTKTNLFANRVLALMNPGMSLISNGLTLAVYAIGAVLIQSAVMSSKLSLFSNMIVFSSYAMQVIMGFLLLSIIFVILPRVTVSISRINEVLDVAPSIHYPSESVTPVTSQAVIEFRDVSFRFAATEANVINHLSFTVQPGQTLAIIGSTGSGKTTVLDLLARRYDVTEGEILVDGVNVKAYPEAELNRKIGYVPQKAVLFSGTIRSNIDFGQTDEHAAALTDDEINEALAIAQASDFVDESTDGLDTPVAQHGDNFSGGQKQRLAIARAVARKSAILMFDDSFSALDYATDQKLRHALREKASGTTKVIVAQRISTIMDADQIIVLDEGNVAGIGTHQSLLADNQVYQEIAYSQLSKEELA